MPKQQLKTIVEFVDGIKITVEAPDADTILRNRHTIYACLADDVCMSAQRQQHRENEDVGSGN